MWSTRYLTHNPSSDSYSMQRPRPTKRSIYRRRRRSLKRSLGHSILSAGLAAVLGGTGVWITEALIAPQASQAYTSRLDLFLAREAEENYEALVHRAEIAAKSGAQRSFNDDLLTTIVSINVVVESEGITIPILALQVNREQWRSHPETYFWAAYYPTAKTLLNASLTISRR